MSQELIDPFGRLIEDLRISITDRCNFRCTYCMPEEGMQWLPAFGRHAVRGDRTARPDLRRAVRRSTGSGSPAANPRSARTSRARREAGGARRTRRPGRSRDDHQRRHDAPDRRHASRGRPAQGQHQPRHARPREVPPDDPARRARPRARRHRGGQGGRIRSGQDQCGHRAQRERRRDRRRWRPMAANRGSRSGSSSSCRSTPTATG